MDEFTDLEKAVNTYYNNVIQITINNIKNYIYQLFQTQKQKIETLYLLYDGNNTAIKKTIPSLTIQIETFLDIKTLTIKNAHINCIYMIQPKSKADIEDRILTAGWNGTAGTLSKEMQNYIIKKLNNNDKTFAAELQYYYFYPTYANIRFKNLVQEKLKREEYVH